MEKIKIMIVDDHAMIRSGIHLIIELQEDMDVIAEASSGELALEILETKVPDIIIMDISLGTLNGIETTEKILKKHSQIKIIALTMYSEEMYLPQFIKAGGVGYLTKSAADRELINVIRGVSKGEVSIQPNGIQVLTKEYQTFSNNKTSDNKLSDREYEVMILTVKGFTSKEIGSQLYLSPRTIETYRSRIMGKLNLKHRSELVDFALRHKLI